MLIVVNEPPRKQSRKRELTAAAVTCGSKPSTLDWPSALSAITAAWTLSKSCTIQAVELGCAKSNLPTKSSSVSSECSGRHVLTPSARVPDVDWLRIGWRRASKAWKADVEAKDEEKYQVGVMSAAKGASTALSFVLPVMLTA